MNKYRVIRFSLMIILLFISFKQSIVYLRKLDPSPSILLKENSGNTISRKDLTKDKIIIQEIQSHFDNLGIISVRFETYNRINNDTLTFRLRKKGDSEWFYTAQYKTDQFQNRELFPFGFPPISNSKGVVYEFELQSNFGTVNEHVTVDELKPIVLTKYSFPLREYGYKSMKFYLYIIQKAVNFITNIRLLFPIIYYFILPLYYVLHIVLTKSRKLSPFLLICLPITIYTIQILLSAPSPSSWKLTCVLFWLLFTFLNNLDYRINLFLSLICLSISMLLIIEGQPFMAELSAEFSFYFLLVSYIQLQFVSNFIPVSFNRFNKYFHFGNSKQ